MRRFQKGNKRSALLIMAVAIGFATGLFLTGNGRLFAQDQEIEAVEAVTGQKSAKNIEGLLASDLKALEAATENETALENAAPDSRLGKIAAYQAAARVTQTKATAYDKAARTLADARTILARAQEELRLVEAAYDGRTTADIAAGINALDPAADDFVEALAALQDESAAALEHEDLVLNWQETIVAAESAVSSAELAESRLASELATAEIAEKAALLEATNNRELAPEALAYFREQLGL
ncbi:MAG: hypothetical protein WBA91_02025 [Paracoccaceae bacterium]